MVDGSMVGGISANYWSRVTLVIPDPCLTHAEGPGVQITAVAGGLYDLAQPDNLSPSVN